MRFIMNLLVASTARRLSTSKSPRQSLSRQSIVKHIALTLVLTSLLLAPFGPTIPSPAYAANSNTGLNSSTNLNTNLNHYAIHADLNYSTGDLTATQKLTFHNSLGQSLDSIVFSVTPAYFGAFQLVGATVDQVPVQPTLEDIVLEVPFANALAPGATATIQLDFTISVPNPGNLRFGHANGMLALGNWFPILAVWRGGDTGWDRHHYVDTGDAFYTSIANYDVTLDVDTPVSIAHTGEVVSHEGSTWQFRANGVRDFALALSDRYETISQSVGNTTVTAFFLPEHAAAGQQYLASAAACMTWCSANLSTYPYPTLHIAETNANDPTWVGQEYPNVIFISNQVSAAGGGVGSYLDYLVVHEVLHQWFYGLVGNDQLYEPWVDEATVTYLSYLSFRENYPGIYDYYWQKAQAREESVKQAWGDMPVNTSIYDYGNEDHYFGIVYSKGAVFMGNLRETMGDAAFFAFLREYLGNYSYGLATARDFLSLAQAHSAADISPLVNSYFDYPDYNSPAATPTIAASTATATAIAATSSPTANQTTTTPTLSPSTPTPTISGQPSPTMATIPDIEPEKPNDEPNSETQIEAEDSLIDILSRDWVYAIPPITLALIIAFIRRNRR